MYDCFCCITFSGFRLIFAVLYCGFDFVFSVLAQKLAGKSGSKMTYFVSSWTLNLNSVNNTG